MFMLHIYLTIDLTWKSSLLYDWTCLWGWFYVFHIYFSFCFKCISCFARMPACIFCWKYVFENVSITTHKQPKKLALQKTVPSVPCPWSAVILQRGDGSASRWYRVERSWGARSKSFKKEKKWKKRNLKQTKATLWVIWTPLAWLRVSAWGVFLISVNFRRGGGLLHVGSVCVPSLSDAGVPFQHAARQPCVAPLAALSGQILWAAPSCCLSLVILGGTAQK